MSIARLDWPAVVRRSWLMPELAVELINGTGGYRDEAVKSMFPELIGTKPEKLCVTGERLLERLGLVSYLEEAIVFRLIDPAAPVILDPEFSIYSGPPRIQATNADLEIRMADGRLIVIACKEDVIKHLGFDGFEVEDYVP